MRLAFLTPNLTPITRFGDKDYSREELVAEIGSAMLCNRIGIENEKAFRNSAAYIQSWLKALKEMYPRYSVLPHPSKEEFYTYGDGKDSIVIHPLYSESPLEWIFYIKNPKGS